jgi:hypothetical protein
MKRNTLLTLIGLVVGAAVTVPSVAQQTTGTADSFSATTTTAGKQNAERNAYFGELHIHSSWSCDAYVFGTRLGQYNNRAKTN